VINTPGDRVSLRFRVGLGEVAAAARQGYAEFDQDAPKKFILDPPQGIIGA
jgi:hypothetical protein